MAQPAADTKKYQWNVGMTCNGCVGQIENILKKINEKLDEGKKVEYKINLEEKSVTVEGKEVDADTISTKIKKWADLKDKTYEYKGEIENK
mmetsp:Transcript_35214/g.31063  ORF Transcript_35214/g.31063 Transcript_35214/m.31063 type:complete len:91 (-) Transcript_35214:88-360(-)